MGETSTPDPAPDPFSAPGAKLRREARMEGVRVSAQLAQLYRWTAPDSAETMMKAIDVGLARIETLNGLALAEETKSSTDAVVRWTKIMVIAVAVQAIAAIASVAVAVLHMIAGKS